MKKFSCTVTIVVAHLLFALSPVANATYLLVTSTGTISGSMDSTNHLGYGYGATGNGINSIAGKSVTFSWALNLDLAGSDILNGTQAGRGAYTGTSCSGIGGSWITTLGVSIDGNSVPSLFDRAPNSSECDQVNVWDKELNGRGIEEISGYDLRVNHVASVYPDGTSLETDFSEQSAFRAGSSIANLFDGVSLNQPFSIIGNQDAFFGGGDFFQQMTIGTCYSGACSSLTSIDVYFAWTAFETTGQIVSSIPEPSAWSLLWLGLLGCFVGRRSSRRVAE